MKVGVNTVRVGDVVEHEGHLCVVQKCNHVMPGKGGAFVQLVMKDVKSNTKYNERFRSSEAIEKAFIDEQKYQYQYMDGDNLMCMNMEDYEQYPFAKQLIDEEILPFLREEMEITVESYEGEPVAISLPENAVYSIAETETVVKNQTATSSFKPAILDNGIKIMVPQFINAGERVIVKIAERLYMEREKK